MKTLNILFNTIDRPDMMFSVMSKNIERAGVKNIAVYATNNGGGEHTWKMLMKLESYFPDVNFHLKNHANNIGNAASLNIMLKSMGYADFIAVLGDDIELKSHWAADAMEKIHQLRNIDVEVGLIGFPWSDTLLKNATKIDDLHVNVNVFGSWVFPWIVYQEHGYFMEFSKYGLWDGEFAVRLHQAGKRNGYLDNHKSIHHDNDVGKKHKYRGMKDEELRKAGLNYMAYRAEHPSKTFVSWEERRYPCKK